MRRSLAVVVLAALALLAAAAPWIAPAAPDFQEDVAGAKLLPPGTRAVAMRLGSGRTYVLTGVRRVDGGYEGERAGQRIHLADAELVGEPRARAYLLGTDSLGRDLTSRLLYALRHSLLLATLAVALALLLGVAVGAASGLCGRFVDALAMRGVDVLLSVPRLLLFLLLAALFRPSILLLVLVLGGTTWPGLARLVRGEILARKSTDLAVAARAAGCSSLRTALVHLLPQAAPVIVVTAALRFADTILLESALSFLGLGAPPPAVSLGEILLLGRDHVVDAWWIVAGPVVLLAILVLAVRSTASRTPAESPSVL